MKCCACKRNIAAGVDAQKMIVEYSQPDATTKIFGYLMSDGPLPAATGRIVRAWHHKHFHAQRKREQRGNAVTGRVLTGIPTGYEIGALTLSREEFDALEHTETQTHSTSYLSERLEKLRAIAHDIGKAVGDATVTEAFRANEHGGPYPHGHHLSLDTYQLMAHLHYAHGYIHHPGAMGSGPVQPIHHTLHATAALEQTRATRNADPGYREPAERDWRDQEVLDIEEMT